MKKYDLIVIGGGAGGLTVASGAASLGAQVALVEKNSSLGGDCLHYGCVPSKSLIAAANEVYHSRKLPDFGFHVTGSVDMKKVKERVKGAVAHIQEHDSTERFENMGVDVFFGAASFEDAHTVTIGNQEKIAGKRIIIATGSRPVIPNFPGLKEAGFETNETIFDREELPETMIFIGGGPIGLEIAQAYSRLGTKTIVLERSEAVLGKEDEEIQQLAIEFLSKEIDIRTEVEVKEVKVDGKNKIVLYEKNGKIEEVIGDALFLGVGRKPNTDTLNLEKIGVEVNERGHIVVNDRLQSSVPHIYGIGDINGAFPFTHGAGMEGKLIVQNAVLGLRRKVSYDTLPWTTYTSPEIFHVGKTEKEARESEDEISVYQNGLEEVDRFVADANVTGTVKIITNKRGKILGAHAVGKGAGDWMQTVIFAMEKGAKIGELSTMIYPYPNHAAAIQRTADQYWREKLFDGMLPKITKKYIQWFR
ncbi:dihydrolipoyl dehydrogenase family protein [Bacillus sp. 2205SS5-2]|uniref:dihydrolipoyl dehydrogenase family protein n=1 Tax=Bacillus sp. 2205SS5-2 TaxID=3109031 RepID=UPI003005D41B